jgi:hypothetical protein
MNSNYSPLFARLVALLIKMHDLPDEYVATCIINIMFMETPHTYRLLFYLEPQILRNKKRLCVVWYIVVERNVSLNFVCKGMDETLY